MNAIKKSIQHLTEDEFVNIMARYLMPSSPVRREELLKGRQPQLEKVRRTLMSPGRNVFVHGLRGVGKTSLAQTAATLFQSSDAIPVTVACEKQTSFSEAIRNLSAKLIRQNPITKSVTRTSKFQFNARYIAAETQKSVVEGTVPLPASLDEAVGMVRFCSTAHSKSPVVVVDEFDRIERTEERLLFGDFIKQVGDQDVGVKFIFCGVGESLEELMADHESAYRYFASVPLERLALNPCMDIIEYAAEKVGLKISRDYLLRAAWISDGFPHFAHLMGEKIFWRVFEDQNLCDEVTSDHFIGGVHEAVNDVERHLKALYDKATKKYGDDYQYVLWAIADHPDTVRRSSDIYGSYKRIAQELKAAEMTRDQFNNRMNSLKKTPHGRILIGTRQGWYRFSNPMLRGYCRLKAQDKKLILGREHFLEQAKSFEDSFTHPTPS